MVCENQKERRRPKKTNLGLNQRSKSMFRKDRKISNIPEKIETVLFIPFTPNSVLKKALQDTERLVNGRRKTCTVRFVEQSGPTVGQLLFNKTPWKGDSCQREACKPCKTQTGSCRKVNVTYRITCMTCSREGIKSTYIGGPYLTGQKSMNKL